MKEDNMESRSKFQKERQKVLRTPLSTACGNEIWAEVVVVVVVMVDPQGVRIMFPCSHFAASTIAEICSFRITYERLKRDEYGKHTREGIWRRISNSGC
jgi:hypothetical protein